MIAAGRLPLVEIHLRLTNPMHQAYAPVYFPGSATQKHGDVFVHAIN